MVNPMISPCDPKFVPADKRAPSTLEVSAGPSKQPNFKGQATVCVDAQS